LVHGDAKLENFLFGPSGAAAVDFQYVGPGPGVVDVAYFLGSALPPRVLSVDTPALLNRYFRSLGGALSGRVEASEAARLEAEWRGLYPTAWADFYRFLAGWAPSEARADDYGRRLTDEVLDSLEREPQHPAEREPLGEHQPTTRRG
jgi:aminoglycoside phosphotransferase (APT) family kinase protein